jgi:hypothetical protein
MNDETRRVLWRYLRYLLLAVLPVVINALGASETPDVQELGIAVLVAALGATYRWLSLSPPQPPPGDS